MSELGFYFKEGIRHITDLKGFDHMLFIITLCAFYKMEEWRKLLILVTAFTIGHSITLALSSLDIIRVNQQLVEVLIPVTILLTSIYNVVAKSKNNVRISYNYMLALFFGLIHGMGFSNYFRSMMTGISDGSIVLPLFGFNLGIEAGQLCIVALFILSLYLFNRFLHVKHRDWKIFISGGGAFLAISMILNSL